MVVIVLLYIGMLSCIGDICTISLSPWSIGALQEGGRGDMPPHFKIKWDLLCIGSPSLLLPQHLF